MNVVVLKSLKSRAFHFGVIIVIFLGWAWKFSSQRWVSQSCGNIMISSRDSGVAIFYRTTPSFGWKLLPHSVNVLELGRQAASPRFARAGLTLRQSLTASEKMELWNTGKLENNALDPVLMDFYLSPHFINDTYLLFIPYWLIVVLFMALWATLLSWRMRKYR